MEKIVVLCTSEDNDKVTKLVTFLRKITTVWWYQDKKKIKWDEAVKNKIRHSEIVIAFLSDKFIDDRHDILRDEMKLAKDLDKGPILFCHGQVDIPLGFGRVDRIAVGEWDGTEGHRAFQELKTRIHKIIKVDVNSKRKHIILHNKTLSLPDFVFSLSSHETQILPNDGVILSSLLEPRALLISAYDIYSINNDERFAGSKENFHATLKEHEKSNTIIFLDSGNYEAKRKNNYYTEYNEHGWRQEKFWETVSDINPDIIFSYDQYEPPSDMRELKQVIVSNYKKDMQALQPKNIPISPIIHIPAQTEIPIGDFAADIVHQIALELNPIMIAIPERELGDGLIERTRNIRTIRKRLDNTGTYYPLHLLGTGNPISIAFFAAAGADSFDGLEWCRTAINYGTVTLFHFQHFDLLENANINRIVNQEVKKIAANKENDFALRVVAYNFDAYNDWINTVKDYIDKDNVQQLLRMTCLHAGQGVQKQIIEELLK